MGTERKQKTVKPEVCSVSFSFCSFLAQLFANLYACVHVHVYAPTEDMLHTSHPVGCGPHTLAPQ